MKMFFSWLKFPLQFIIAIGVAGVLVFELIRPFTNFPPGSFGPLNPDGTPFQIWPPFAAQFSYFTVITNILFALTLLATWGIRLKVNPYWKNAIATYLMLLLIVFFTIIAPYANWNDNWWLTALLIWQHLGVVVIGLWWFFNTKTTKGSRPVISFFVTITIPLLYFGFVIAIYFIYNVVPYNFLNFKNAYNANFPIIISITLSVVTILVIFLLIIGFNGLFVSFTNNLKTKKSNKTVLSTNEPNRFTTYLENHEDSEVDVVPASAATIVKVKKSQPNKKQNNKQQKKKTKPMTKTTMAKKPQPKQKMVKSKTSACKPETKKTNNTPEKIQKTTIIKKDKGSDHEVVEVTETTIIKKTTYK